MENWVILLKFIILSYCITKYVYAGMKNMTFAILAILLYICMNMLYYIFRNNIIKTACSFLSITILLSCVYWIVPVFLLLLPLSIADLIFSYGENIYLVIIFSIIPVAFTGLNLLSEYILICALSFTTYMLILKAYKKLDMLSKSVDELRVKNNLLVTKLDRSSEYENQLRQMTQMEERNRIAQEIHDRLGHMISGSIIQLEAARMLAQRDHAKAEQMIANVINVLREGMEHIRSSLKDLKPPPEQLGINRIRLLLDRFSSENNIKTTLLHKGSLDRVTYVQWKVMFENIKEALTNVLKYSKASSVTVNIEVLNKFLKADVHDNGLGAQVIKKGLGISGMEERSQSLGGKLITDGSNGFSVITLLPLEEDIYADKGSDSGR